MRKPAANAVPAVRAARLTRIRELILVLAVLGAAAVSAPVIAADRDLAGDFAAAFHWVGRGLGTLTVPVFACLVSVCGLHYLAAAISARAAAGVPMPYRELVGAQLAAAAANRLTPAGLGGAALLGRFFIRRGRLQPAAAGAALSALALLGGVADVLAFAVLIGAGLLLGVGGATGEVPLLVHRLAGLVPLPSGWSRWALLGVAGLVLLVAAAPPLRRRIFTARVRAAVRTYRGSLAMLLRRPSRLAALVLASATTTLILAAGFAAAATLSPAGLPASSFAPLMIGYMVASAASNALPTPGGIGTADAALAGVLLAGGMPSAGAVASVLAFRLVTFWAPAVVGACLARQLRRRGAL